MQVVFNADVEDSIQMHIKTNSLLVANWKRTCFVLYVATMNTKLNASEKNDRFLFRQQKVVEKVFLQYVPYRRAKARGTSQKQHSFLFFYFLEYAT